MKKETQEKPDKQPRVYKETEFRLMCEFIELGLWRTINLSRAVGCDQETIAKWKKMPEAQKSYQKAVKSILAKRKIKGDVEKLMKEVNMEVDADEVNIRVIEVIGLESI